MARWEPDARERLADAALALFSEKGYQAVTITEITERAGLTRASYFRHFADKREAVFAGQDLLVDVIHQAIADAAETAGPRELLDAALDAVAVAFTPGRHAQAATRQAIIDSEAELRERLTAKRAAIAEAFTAALLDRGLPTTTAQVAGQLGQLAFTTASRRWTDSPDGTGFSAYARSALDAAVAAAADLTGR